MIMQSQNYIYNANNVMIRITVKTYRPTGKHDHFFALSKPIILICELLVVLI